MYIVQVAGPNQLLKSDDNEFEGELSKIVNSRFNFKGKNRFSIKLKLWSDFDAMA